eukprot:TRINITY_DN88357_c0_g1_i1.p2 TRINITY_DN88357_c0_g1~~TRINITY_DN88357_c0_g1_i1.p2  ORF type:complete len:154 (-),score=16.90 TRINITY_DN88357_c0_g1_i1:373-801(-)
MQTDPPSFPLLRILVLAVCTLAVMGLAAAKECTCHLELYAGKGCKGAPINQTTIRGTSEHCEQDIILSYKFSDDCKLTMYEEDLCEGEDHKIPKKGCKSETFKQDGTKTEISFKSDCSSSVRNWPRKLMWCALSAVAACAVY